MENSTSVSNSSNNNNNNENLTRDEILERRKQAKERRKLAKQKRRAALGKAKAIDLGLADQVTYQPGGLDGQTFRAQSGLPDTNRPFIVLGIESSCDDTGAAVVSSDGRILGQALAHQADIHEEWGGIVPGLARQAHQEQIDIVIEQALSEAGLDSPAQVDAIGVTVGPGLEICLRVGCQAAVALAVEYQKPFVGVHHLEAHILMARLPPQQEQLENGSNTTNNSQPQPQPQQPPLVHRPATDTTHATVRTMDFPFLALLVSGGHCQLIQCLGVGHYVILGGTLDDSLGEAFDKVARLLGLPVGGGRGGPAVEALARQGRCDAINLPIPLRHRKTMDFSYAGLKTAVRKAAEGLAEQHDASSIDQLPTNVKADIAASFQHAALQHIEQRLGYAMTAMQEQNNITTLAVVGGVAANQELKRRLEEMCAQRSWQLQVPPPQLCTDQGAMSAWAAVERLWLGSSDDPALQEVYARFPFANLQQRANASNDNGSTS
mmetsp:Transcript_17465/g.40658  ORF Transcript_17465/g.40658 Transcript_17465/m.40658 type:complete len:492 (+) Transcript_17465:131-1606(+)